MSWKGRGRTEDGRRCLNPVALPPLSGRYIRKVIRPRKERVTTVQEEISKLSVPFAIPGDLEEPTKPQGNSKILEVPGAFWGRPGASWGHPGAS